MALHTALYKKMHILLPFSLLFTSPLVSATNGYFTHGKSIIEKSQAGAGVAQTEINYGLNNNPAQLNDGQHVSGFEIGAAIFAPSREYRVTGQPSIPEGVFCGNQCPFSIGDGNQSIKSDNKVFVIPQFGLRYQLDDISHINFSVFANGGMNTKYKGGTAQLAPQGTSTQFNGTFGNGTTGVDLAQVFTAFAYSRNLFDNNLAIGASVFYAYQQIELTGLMNFAGFSTNPATLSSKGVDSSDGFGWRLGGQYKVSPSLHLGATYQAKVSMSRFEDYAGLFAEQGKFDIPSSWTLGLAYQVTESSEFLFDFQTINYGDVASVANSMSQLTNGSCMPGAQGGTGAGCLGGNQGAGFGWSDMEIYKVGYKWNYSDHVTLRAGVSKTDQPIESKEVLFAILTPAVIEYHYTLGASYQLASQDNLHFSFMYAPENSVSGQNNFDPNQTITVAMSQIELGLSYQGKW
jgi:long-chain fatty acid transport protein